MQVSGGCAEAGLDLRRFSQTCLRRGQRRLFAAGAIPRCPAGSENEAWPHRQWRNYRCVLLNARCIDMEFPSETASSGRAAPDVVRERSNGRSRQQTFRKQVKGCRRRDNAPRPCAPERRNSGPYRTILAVATCVLNSTKVLDAGTTQRFPRGCIPQSEGGRDLPERSKRRRKVAVQRRSSL